MPGAVVRRDVPPGALAVSRGPQRNVDDWVQRKRPGHRQAAAGRERARTPSRRIARRPTASPTEEADHVTGIKRTTEKNLMLFSGRAHPELAEEVAELLGDRAGADDAYDFANSEIYVRYQESVRGCDAFVIQSHTAPINEWIMEHLIMVDALKRASAKRITVVLPFYGYARQDKKHRGREPISARLMADLFKTAGADRLIAVDLHTAQIQGFFDGPVDHLVALPVLADYVARQVRRRGARRSSRRTPAGSRSPSSGRPGSAARRWPSSTRPATSTSPTRPSANRVVGEVKGRVCVLVDDMIDTGGTIVKAADALMDAGAADVVIAATHAILSGPGRRPAEELPGHARSIVTNTLPIPAERQFDKLTDAVDRAADQPRRSARSSRTAR